MTEGSSEHAAGKRLKCPGCAYTTVVWEDDGHIAICPKCNVDGLMPEETAATVRTNRMRESGVFEDYVQMDYDELAISDDEPVRLMDEVQTVDMSIRPSAVEIDREEMKSAIEEHIESMKQIEAANERRADHSRYPRRGETR